MSPGQSSRSPAFILSLLALLAVAATGCAPTPREVIRKTQSAENPPGALGPFFDTQFAGWLIKPSLQVCRYEADCVYYEGSYASTYFRNLGTVRYSEPVVVTLVAEAFVSQGGWRSTAKGIVKRWLTCFIPEDSTRIYFFHSRNDEIASRVQMNKSLVKLYYVDATDAQPYEKLKSSCGPIDKTTTISFE